MPVRHLPEAVAADPVLDQGGDAILVPATTLCPILTYPVGHALATAAAMIVTNVCLAKAADHRER